MLALTLAVPAFALEESDVEAAVSSSSREAVTGNVLVWFLCAVGFLKVSQKIDSFMASIGVNVGHIDAGSLTLNPGDTVAVEVKKSLARHLAGREFTVSFPQSDHTYTIQASKHNDWHEFTVPAEEEQEAPV